MIQHPRVQPEQVGKAPRFGCRSSWPQETATCWATSWVPRGFLMVIDLLSGKWKLPATNQSLSLRPWLQNIHPSLRFQAGFAHLPLSSPELASQIA